MHRTRRPVAASRTVTRAHGVRTGAAPSPSKPTVAIWCCSVSVRMLTRRLRDLRDPGGQLATDVQSSARGGFRTASYAHDRSDASLVVDRSDTHRVRIGTGVSECRGTPDKVCRRTSHSSLRGRALPTAPSSRTAPARSAARRGACHGPAARAGCRAAAARWGRRGRTCPACRGRPGRRGAPDGSANGISEQSSPGPKPSALERGVDRVQVGAQPARALGVVGGAVHLQPGEAEVVGGGLDPGGVLGAPAAAPRSRPGSGGTRPRSAARKQTEPSPVGVSPAAVCSVIAALGTRNSASRLARLGRVRPVIASQRPTGATVRRTVSRTAG